MIICFSSLKSSAGTRIDSIPCIRSPQIGFRPAPAFLVRFVFVMLQYYDKLFTL